MDRAPDHRPRIGSISVPSRGSDRLRSVQAGKEFSVEILYAYRLYTKSAQSRGPENIDPERPLPGLPAQGPVLSPARITLENNGKIRPQPDGENAFARASGGGGGAEIERSLLFGCAITDSAL